MNDTIRMIKCDVDSLYRIRNGHFDKDKQYIRKFKVILNETNIIQLINDIEKRLIGKNEFISAIQSDTKYKEQILQLQHQLEEANELIQEYYAQLGYNYALSVVEDTVSYAKKYKIKLGDDKNERKKRIKSENSRKKIQK